MAQLKYLQISRKQIKSQMIWLKMSKGELERRLSWFSKFLRQIHQPVSKTSFLSPMAATGTSYGLAGQLAQLKQ